MPRQTVQTSDSVAKPRAGGSFAPPLDEDGKQLAAYRNLAEQAPEQIRDAMLVLLACVEKWWELPESGPSGSVPHPSGRGTIVPLDEPIAKALYDHIPWPEELAMYAGLFERIDPADAQLRNAAFHLLWFANELNLDREPITSDRL